MRTIFALCLVRRGGTDSEAKRSATRGENVNGRLVSFFLREDGLYAAVLCRPRAERGSIILRRILEAIIPNIREDHQQGRAARGDGVSHSLARTG
jgi:hypothetical protein